MVERRRYAVQGSVQGVGFRPFVYRLAHEMHLGGWVVNSAQGAIVEVEAEGETLDRFAQRLRGELPAHAAISTLDMEEKRVRGERDFRIAPSESNGHKSAHLLPDLATCPECLRELRDPGDRRYRYPFLNCTHCGPRYTILRSLPYDRPNTSMRGFALCPACQAEYDDPLDRRFHAQPVACPICGPQVTLRDADGFALATREEAIRRAEDAIRWGEIVAVKGVGGFHLLVDARNDDAVRELRRRKGRDEKPFAVMFPDLAALECVCEADDAERTLLTSSAAPIVLLRKRVTGESLSSLIAPGNPNLGAFLPYTPLHHLLLGDLGFPVVATSANLSGDPLCTDLAELLDRVPGVANLILDHDRPIVRPCDDSVLALALGEPLMLRRARGYAPQPVAHLSTSQTVVATGAQQKSTVALLHDGDLFLSQHIGDMDSAAAVDLMTRTVSDLAAIYEAQIDIVACDRHPDYASTRLAERLTSPPAPLQRRGGHSPLSSGEGPGVRYIQHHRAHLLSCILEHTLAPPVLGVIWDGTGYGDDGAIWGGEFLRIDRLEGDPNRAIRRVAHLRPFPLPGGDAAAREPRRALLGLLYALYGEDMPLDKVAFAPDEIRLLRSALRTGVNTPSTTSAGRLFDAVAALLGLRQRSSFEAQVAMEVEFAAQGVTTEACYPFALSLDSDTDADGNACATIDLKPMIDEMLLESPAPPGSAQVETAARKFHNTLAEAIVAVAQREGVPTVALSGGCFQNRLLLERTVKALRREGFTPSWQQRIPANDGGIAAGQIYGATMGAEGD